MLPQGFILVLGAFIKKARSELVDRSHQYFLLLCLEDSLPKYRLTETTSYRWALSCEHEEYENKGKAKDLNTT